MTANPSGQKPEEPPAQTYPQANAVSEQAYQRGKIAELAQAVKSGEVDPKDLPQPPPPLSWT